MSRDLPAEVLERFKMIEERLKIHEFFVLVADYAATHAHLLVLVFRIYEVCCNLRLRENQDAM